MKSKKLLSEENIAITVKRLCYQLIENHNDFSDTVIIGIQPRGVHLCSRIIDTLREILSKKIKLQYGNLDITFFRDDFRRREPIKPSETKIDFIIENKKVILVDDVLYTGRTIRAGLDALLAFGRPEKVELLILIDRKYSRDLPIEAHYVGKSIDTIASDKVKVSWKETDGEDSVSIYTQD